MKGVRLEGIKVVRKPGGKVYKYRRIRGQLVPLPDLPENHPDFMRAYIEAGDFTPRDDSLGALIGMFLASDDFKTRKLTTQKVWRRRLAYMQIEYGMAPAPKLTTVHIEKALRKLPPGAARSERTIWRALMAYAKAEHWRTDNPAKDAEVRTLRSTPHAPWTREDVEAFRTAWPHGTPQRQAFEVLHWTGARCVDAVRIGWQGVGPDGLLTFTQEKTGGEAMVPITAVADRRLERDRKEFIHAASPELQFILTEYGRARSVKGLSNLIAAAARKAGLTGRTAHGLRKTRAIALAELLWTPHQIGAWTGHETLQEITEYTRAANKRALLLGNSDGNSGGAVVHFRGKTEG
ncbi:tyrosine-type recombinase/integrase [Primorskyibacter sp. 2E107]|uniref:tyrosine-type recombinase/integrase n=1 Tax=Primorskyibacter sp. 2E107 TaxID=3403458 RepID=UPI003AF77F4D